MKSKGACSFEAGSSLVRAVRGARVGGVQPQPEATREVVLLKPWDSPSGKGSEWEKRGMESNNSWFASLRKTVGQWKAE